MRAVGTALAALVMLMALSPLPAAAQLGEPTGRSDATLPDIEDEVMCTICGTALQLANSPQADRERAFIRKLIAKGEDKQQIKDALVVEYGSDVLAVPAAEGFNLAAWIVPIGAVGVAAVAIALAARRWRRSGARRAEANAGAAEIDPADAERLRNDLGRYQV